MGDEHFKLAWARRRRYDGNADPEDRATQACDPRAEIRGYTVVLARNRSGHLSSLRITGIPNPINASSLGPTGNLARGKDNEDPTGGTYVTIYGAEKLR
jgi:hypothetical protein